MKATAVPQSLAEFRRVEYARPLDDATDGGARIALLRGNRCLLWVASGAPVLLSAAAALALPGEAVFVGLDEHDRSLFAYMLEGDIGEGLVFDLLGVAPTEVRFADPMFALGALEAAARALIVTALGLSRWSAAERFCSLCAAPMAWDESGRTKSCANPGEPHRHFPRLDPATIMLVHDGERALLGRQRTWPGGMYSTLAGFVEPGESLEEAVVREVYEEAGVRVDHVRYFSSEPWPFPRSIMLGFFARARTFDIRTGDELEEARWFSRPEVAALSQRMQASRPNLDTIARRLMLDWLNRPGDGR